jgi:hypothetical protein
LKSNAFFSLKFILKSNRPLYDFSDQLFVRMTKPMISVSGVFHSVRSISF